MKSRISRRAFLTLSSLAAAASMLPGTSRATGKTTTRTLGRTGLKVSEVGMGVMITSDPAVVTTALDAGITYFDTARAYGGGNNEAVVAEGLGKRRKEVVVATKTAPHGDRNSIIASCEESLKQLKTDYIDILQLHGVGSRAQTLDAENIAGLEALKKSGKVRFIGVTTHGNMPEVLKAAVEAKVYDTVLTVYNFQTGSEMDAAVKETAAAGLGVIAMKIMTGGYTMTPFPNLNPYQSALRWVLQNKGTGTTIPSMTTFDQVRENAAVMGTTYSWRDRSALGLYALATEGRYCRMCGGCTGSCPAGVDVPAVMRGLMYAEGYRRPGLGREVVAGALSTCGDCADCAVTCRHGLPVGERLATARALLRGDIHAG